MRFYTQQHKFYCGIDLHTQNMTNWGRWFKCNLIFVHLSATPLDDTVNSRTLRLNVNSLLWHQPIYHYVINLSAILAYRCILLLPFGNVNFCLNRYPRWRAAVKIFSFAMQSCI